MRRGDPSAARPRAANGTGNINHHGYRLLYLPDHPNAQKRGYVFEHVVVMARSLGRALGPDETVHHINGDRLDNRIENLELWSRAQPPGQRVVDKVAWAESIVRTYRGHEPEDLHDW